MSIIRTSHDKDRPYVVLNKQALEDSELSWGAKGLWAYLLGRPDDWRISVAHLSKLYNKKGGGEKAIYSLLNELIEAGYCSRQQVKDEGGRFTKTEYVITELKNKVPHSPQGDAVERDAVEGGTTNKGVILNKEESNTTTSPPQNLELINLAKSGGGGQTLSFKDGKGRMHSVSDSEIYRHFIKLAYPTEIVKSAILEAQRTPGPINSIFKYLESICARLSAPSITNVHNLSKPKESKDYPPKRNDPGITFADYARRMQNVT